MAKSNSSSSRVAQRCQKDGHPWQVEGKAMQTTKQVKFSTPGLCWGGGGREDGRIRRKRSDSEVSIELSLGKQVAVYQADRERSHSRFQFST